MSETFDPSWLALREPIDHRARAAGLLEPLRDWWVARGAEAVLDLGSGTGSNVRYLAPRLPGAQRWTAFDHDAELLARVSAPSADVDVRAVVGDLSAVGPYEVRDADLVTASALLDLVSAPWLRGLVDACVASRCGALFALSYDGEIDWPGDEDGPLDLAVRDAVNEHQRRDKGLGPALGPDAAVAAEARFRASGYATWLLPSPWRLGPEDAALAEPLIDGWVAAASEVRPSLAGELRTWGARRRRRVGASDFALVVGHWDLLALPPATVRSAT